MLWATLHKCWPACFTLTTFLSVSVCQFSRISTGKVSLPELCCFLYLGQWCLLHLFFLLVSCFILLKKKVRCTFLNRFAYLLRCFSYHTEPDSQPCHLSLPYNHCECSLDLFLLMFHLMFIIKTVTSLSIKWRIVLIIISMTLCVSAVD